MVYAVSHLKNRGHGSRIIEAALQMGGRFYDTFFLRRNPIMKKLLAILVASVLCLSMAAIAEETYTVGICQLKGPTP